MSDTERRYDMEVLPFGSLDLERLGEDLQDDGVKITHTPRIHPVEYSLDVIHRLIDRLQEL